MKKEKDEFLVQLWATWDSVVAYERKKEKFQVKLQEEKRAGEAQLQKEKEQLIVEQTMVKYAISKACHFVSSLVQEEQEPIETQVANLIETLKQF